MNFKTHLTTLAPACVLPLAFASVAVASTRIEVYSQRANYVNGMRIDVLAGTFATNPTPLIVTVNDLVPQVPLLVRGSGFSIGRPNLRFNQPIKLYVPYDVDSLPVGGLEANLTLNRVYNNRLQVIPSTVDPINHMVTANITVPGTYALVASVSNSPVTNQLLLRTKIGSYRVTLAANSNPFGTPAPTDPPDNFELVNATYPGYQSRLSTSLDSVFTFFRDGHNLYNPYLLTPDGTYPFRLATVDLDDVLAVSYAFDGKNIAYIGRKGSIYKLIRTDVSGNSRVVRISPDLANPSLAWTPDGLNIYVNGPTGASNEVDRIDSVTGVTNVVYPYSGFVGVVTCTNPMSGEAYGYKPAGMTGNGFFRTDTPGTSVVSMAPAASNNLACFTGLAGGTDIAYQFYGSHEFHSSTGALHGRLASPHNLQEEFLQIMAQ